MRRLTHDEHLSLEFATTWSQYDLDPQTRALLGYAQKLTETPSLVDDADVEALRAAGWDQHGIDQATALIAFYNFSTILGAFCLLANFPSRVICLRYDIFLLERKAQASFGACEEKTWALPWKCTLLIKKSLS